VVYITKLVKVSDKVYSELKAIKEELGLSSLSDTVAFLVEFFRFSLASAATVRLIGDLGRINPYQIAIEAMEEAIRKLRERSSQPAQE